MFDYDDFDFQEFMEEEREIQQREEERRRQQNSSYTTMSLSLESSNIMSTNLYEKPAVNLYQLCTGLLILSFAEPMFASKIFISSHFLLSFLHQPLHQFLFNLLPRHGGIILLAGVQNHIRISQKLLVLQFAFHIQHKLLIRGKM